MYAQDWDDKFPLTAEEYFARIHGKPILRDVTKVYISNDSSWRCPSDVGEIWPNQMGGYGKPTPPLYVLNRTSYSFLGEPFNYYAGRSIGSLKKPALSPMVHETRPWHGYYRRDESAYKSPALLNVLYADGHVGQRTWLQYQWDQYYAFPQ